MKSIEVPKFTPGVGSRGDLKLLENPLGDYVRRLKLFETLPFVRSYKEDLFLTYGVKD